MKWKDASEKINLGKKYLKALNDQLDIVWLEKK